MSAPVRGSACAGALGGDSRPGYPAAGGGDGGGGDRACGRQTRPCYNCTAWFSCLPCGDLPGSPGHRAVRRATGRPLGGGSASATRRPSCGPGSARSPGPGLPLARRSLLLPSPSPARGRAAAAAAHSAWRGGVVLAPQPPCRADPAHLLTPPRQQSRPRAQPRACVTAQPAGSGSSRA